MRIPSLDGLRGLAAVVVLVHHCLLTFPALAAVYYDDRRPPGSLLSWEALAAYTPLHLGWAGEEAVLVFFVLSGVVLAGPLARGVAVSWPGYYARRVVRLYVPVVGAAVVGYAVVLLLPRPGASAESAWLAARPPLASVSDALRDVTLVGGVSRVISPLWSLQWEVIFSLALPVVVLLARRAVRHRVVAVVAMLAVSTLGALGGSQALLYLPVFGLGALVGADDRLLRPRTVTTGRLHWVAAATVTALLLALYWMLRPWTVSPLLHGATRPFVITGAVLSVVLAAGWAPARTLLTTPVLQWLGRLSFSLYLVHEPVVIAFAATGGDPVVVVLAAVGVSVLLAWVFFHLVEGPSHRLAKRAGAAVERRASTRTAPVTTT